MTVISGRDRVRGPHLPGRIAGAASSFAPAFLTAGLIALILGEGGSFLLRPQSQEGACKGRVD